MDEMHGRKLKVQRRKKNGLLLIFGFLSRQRLLISCHDSESSVAIRLGIGRVSWVVTGQCVSLQCLRASAATRPDACGQAALGAQQSVRACGRETLLQQIILYRDRVVQ